MAFGVIVRPRAGGKTYHIHRYLHTNPNAELLVANMAMKKNAVDAYRRQFPDDRNDIDKRIFTVGDYCDGRHRGIDLKDVLIDDADIVIPILLERLLGQSLSGHLILAATGVVL